jgi:hypothetical protein
MKNLIKDRFVTSGKGFCVSISALYTCPLDERGGGEVGAALKSPKDGAAAKRSLYALCTTI